MHWPELQRPVLKRVESRSHRWFQPVAWRLRSRWCVSQWQEARATHRHQGWCDWLMEALHQHLPSHSHGHKLHVYCRLWLSKPANISYDVSSALSYLISPQQPVLNGWGIEVAIAVKMIYITNMKIWIFIDPVMERSSRSESSVGLFFDSILFNCNPYFTMTYVFCNPWSEVVWQQT